jgi:hypothetical protein
MADKDFNIEGSYSKLKEEFKLPKFQELNSEFELEFIDKEQFLLRSIRRRMNEKVIFFCRIIETVIFPQAASYINVVENKVFTEEEKQKYLKLYREFMEFERRSLRVDAQSSDDKDAKYIKDLFKIWPRFKKETESFIHKLEKAWKEEEKVTTEGFFG